MSKRRCRWGAGYGLFRLDWCHDRRGAADGREGECHADRQIHGPCSERADERAERRAGGEPSESHGGASSSRASGRRQCHHPQPDRARRRRSGRPAGRAGQGHCGDSCRDRKRRRPAADGYRAGADSSGRRRRLEVAWRQLSCRRRAAPRHGQVQGRHRRPSEGIRC